MSIIKLLLWIMFTMNVMVASRENKYYISVETTRNCSELLFVCVEKKIWKVWSLLTPPTIVPCIIMVLNMNDNRHSINMTFSMSLLSHQLRVSQDNLSWTCIIYLDISYLHQSLPLSLRSDWSMIGHLTRFSALIGYWSGWQSFNGTIKCICPNWIKWSLSLMWQ